MGATLIETILEAATEWADQNQIDGRRTISLRRHLRHSLEDLGLVSDDSSKVTREGKKIEILTLIKGTKIKTLQQIAKALGYKSPGTVHKLLKELEQEGLVKNEKTRLGRWKPVTSTDQN
jgi:predicted transcriptional regulator